MKTFFDEATDKRLLEANSKEEVMAIIAETPEAEKLADKADLVMAELERIKGSLDEEVSLDELDSAAGGAKRIKVELSPTQSCIATFFLEDRNNFDFCSSNDQCYASNEYDYHYTKYSNCKKGGRHDWGTGTGKVSTDGFGGYTDTTYSTKTTTVHQCKKCGLKMYPCSADSYYNFNC